eukprot:6892182-Alexandrium_andersonii.AAC.1
MTPRHVPQTAGLHACGATTHQVPRGAATPTTVRERERGAPSRRAACPDAVAQPSEEAATAAGPGVRRAGMPKGSTSRTL